MEMSIGHTDEARALVETGAIKPGDKALDVPVSSMSDREILEEMLIHSRNSRDAITALVAGIQSSPIGKMIAGGNVSPMAFFGGGPAGSNG